MGGIPKQRISELFKQFGITFVRRTMPINDKFFDTIDSEEKAYILGFLVADGCVREEKRKNGISYRIAFNNSIDDKEAIELIHSLICPKAKLLIKNSSTETIKRKDSYILQWGSNYMADILKNKYNILPHKTLGSTFCIPENSIPNDLWRHFIRGFFDGDGHCGKYDIGFVFTSIPFMKQVLNPFKEFNIKVYKIEGKTCIYYKVVIHGGQKILNFTKNYFYKDAHYYLNRKYNQFNAEVKSEIAQGSEPP